MKREAQKNDSLVIRPSREKRKRDVSWSELLRVLRSSGCTLKKEKGISYTRQIIGLLWTVLRFPLGWKDYYLYGLWGFPQNTLCETFFSHDEHIKRLLKLYGSLDVPPLWCKVEFYEFCRVHKLPTAPVISLFENGVQRNVAGWRSEFCEHDVYVKPFSGYAGKDVERWNFKQGSFVRKGVEYSRDEFEEYLLKRSISQSLVLQPRLINHPDLEHLASGLCTVRLTTSRGRDGRVICIMPCFRVPRSFSEVDNFSKSGLAVEVTESTGELGRWFVRRNGISFELSCHPDTGEEIDHMSLPYWDEVRELCIKAQELCRDENFVGWDVAITPSGPLLVEGNRVFGIDLLQTVHRHGIFATPFSQHYDEHLG